MAQVSGLIARIVEMVVEGRIHEATQGSPTCSGLFSMTVGDDLESGDASRY